MVDIDFIKWLCEKAEGFKYDFANYPKCEKVVILNGLCYQIRDFEDEFKKNIYPLLLQRAIEGVNDDESDKWLIVQVGNHIRMYDSESPFNIPEIIFKFSEMSKDTAKESVLKYVKENS